MRFVVLFLLFFCFWGLVNDLDGTPPRDFDNTPIKAYCKQVRREKGWTVVGEGRAWHKGHRQITLLLKGPQRVTIDQARKVFVEESQRLIAQLNNNKNIRSYLNGAPFTFQNLALSISFQDASNRFVCEPFVASVFLAGDRLIYDKSIPQSSMLSKMYEEPFSEAIRIVEEGG